jgi:ABC-type glutathione transport system ATPase component
VGGAQTTGEKEGTPREYIEEGLTIGECSGGQKQLIYILRQLAARKPVLLCDELMIGLDMERQGRLLAMMRKRKPDLVSVHLRLSVSMSVRPSSVWAAAAAAAEGMYGGSRRAVAWSVQALLWITTDLHCMAVMCTSAEDEVLFMHEGAIVERRPVRACIVHGRSPAGPGFPAGQPIREGGPFA